MTLRKKFSERYARAPMEIRQKAPYLMTILIVLHFLALLLVASDFIESEPLSEVIPHTVLYLIVVASLVGLYKGKYVIVGNLLFILMTLAFAALRFAEPYGGAGSLALYAAILGSFLVFGAVFISSRGVLFFLSGFYFLSYGLYLVLIALPAVGDYPLNINDILYPTIAVTTIAVALSITRLLFDRIINTTVKTLEEVRQRESWARSLAETSSKQMAESSRLLDSAGRTSDAAKEIERSISSINERFETLYQRVDGSLGELGTVKSSADEMTRLSREQLRRFDDSGEAVRSMASAINEVTAVIAKRADEVKGLTGRAARGADMVAGTEEAFAKVEETVDAIKDMARIITDIAERTNLLAMNASIQAAHAGEAGKGFAVVAGEVRTLSESTSRSAGSIARSLEELVQAMGGAGDSLGSTKTVFGELSRDIESFGADIREIGQNVEELEAGSRELLETNESLRKISEEVDGQSHRVGESQQSIYSAVESLSQLASEMAGETRDISQGTTLISRAVEEICTLASELESQSRELNKEIT